jgi:hypothetical protein
MTLIHRNDAVTLTQAKNPTPYMPDHAGNLKHQLLYHRLVALALGALAHRCVGLVQRVLSIQTKQIHRYYCEFEHQVVGVKLGAGQMLQKPTSTYVALGYRGVEQDNPELGIKYRDKKSRLTEQEIKLPSRSQAVEPTIEHLKEDHHMGRYHLRVKKVFESMQCCVLTGTTSAEYCMIAKSLRAFTCLVEMTGIQAAGAWFSRIWTSITLTVVHPILQLGWMFILQGRRNATFIG